MRTVKHTGRSRDGNLHALLFRNAPLIRLHFGSLGSADHQAFPNDEPENNDERDN
jgi:hypothetical protein